MTKEPRDVFAFRLNKEEREQLSFLADKHGVSMSNMVRLLIKRSYTGSTTGGIRK